MNFLIPRDVARGMRKVGIGHLCVLEKVTWEKSIHCLFLLCKDKKGNHFRGLKHMEIKKCREKEMMKIIK